MPALAPPRDELHISQRAAWQSIDGLQVNASVIQAPGEQRLCLQSPAAGYLIGVTLDLRGRVVSFAASQTAGALDIRTGQCTVIPVRAGQPLQAHYQGGTHITGISLFVPATWVERHAPGDGLIEGFGRQMQGHAALQTALSPDTLATAARLLHNPYRDHLGALFVEARAHDLLLQIVGTIGGAAARKDANASRPPTRGVRHRMQRARDILDQHWRDPPSLAMLARQAGTSVSSLRKEFAAVAGLPVASYVRRQRLQAARQAIQQGMPMDDAARLAGYSSVANFCTGFRREFQMSPGQLRAR